MNTERFKLIVAVHLFLVRDGEILLMHRQSEEERIDLFFTAPDWQGTPTIIENNKCDDMGWFPIDRCPQ